jgi:putative glycosyltransferase (TIGR04372 family)
MLLTPILHKSKSFLRFIFYGFNYFFGFLLFIPFIPFIRIIDIYYERIGHLLLETDCLLRDESLHSKKKYKWILLIDSNKKVANTAFFELIANKYNVIYLHSLFFFFIKIPKYIIVDTYKYCKAYKDNALCFSIQSKRIINDSSFYKVPDNWMSIHNSTLKKWGLPQNAKYVCLHVREGGYSPSDEKHHQYRNGDIFSYIPVIKFLASREIYVIRIGDKTMKPLPKLPFLVDYALSPEKSEILDLTLGAHCLFILGTSSGAILLASIFGRPSCCTNMSLPFGFSAIGASYDIGIPKLFKRKGNGELVHFRELYNTGASEYRSAHEIDQSPYLLVDNTEDEICEITEEMLDRLNGNWKEREEDGKLQAQLLNLMPTKAYSYGTASRCGTLFLRRYSKLIS